jgi:uncharacterized protein
LFVVRVTCAELLESHNGELLITPYVLTEACYLLAKYVSPDAEINLIEAVAAEDLTQVPTESATRRRHPRRTGLGIGFRRRAE